MGIAFTSAGSKYLESSEQVITAAGFTLSGWGRRPATTDYAFILTLVTSSDTFLRSFIAIDATTGIGHLNIEPSTGTATALTANSVGANVWAHVCGRSVTTTNSRVCLNGDIANEGTTSTSTSTYPPNQDRVAIGALTDTTPLYANNHAAEVAIWDVSLSDAEVIALSKGYSPLLIRPTNLIRYYPLYDTATPSRELITGAGPTWFNSPVVTDHPRIIYPARRHIITVPAAVGAANPHNPFGHPLYGPFAGPVS